MVQFLMSKEEAHSVMSGSSSCSSCNCKIHLAAINGQLFLPILPIGEAF